MSRRAERDAGFTLIEVIVAIGILGLVVVTVLPQLVFGIRANDLARSNTQAKGLVQAELERMRNLPFHVAPDAGDYVDVLDRYFRDLVAPSTTPSCGTSSHWAVPLAGWTGYVASGGTRCPWEPASGAFYRHVRTAPATITNPDLTGFVIVTDTRFLSNSTPATVITPPTGYTTQVTGRATPPASQIGVTVTVFATRRTAHTPVSSSTQIGREDLAESRMSSSVAVSAIELGTGTVDQLPVTLSAGLVHLSSSLTGSSQARGTLSSALTGLGTGQQAGGATASVSAPPAATVASDSQADGRLDASGCALVCWGATQQSGMAASATEALPNVGSPSAPLMTAVTDLTNGGLSLAGGDGATYRPALSLSLPLARVDTGSGIKTGVSTACTTAETGGTARVAAAGWLRTTSPTDTVAPTLVEACGVARTSRLSILPTSFAPSGVVRVSLDRASVRCAVSGGAHTASATYDYSAVVERWSASGYVTVATVVPGATTDVLAAIDLESVALGDGHGMLGDYIETWSAITVAGVAVQQASGVATLDLPGVVDVVTRPTRVDATGLAPDVTSAVSLSLGNLACSATDDR
ncbi:prepilin-type N-terminal cleavage/methylation domain-containing protein [Nocardioides sp.]|uniref:type IV pilus modification PilV family protein n=1 Tax=Nocardioides sp. TaxID=35761 RepID=UPI002734E027|nr:type II secretion system protein [Nocardioides sp.]MDP3894872.1 type II secretion system protein [Nocardioides sp.]